MFCDFNKGDRIAWRKDPTQIRDNFGFVSMFNEKLPKLKKEFGEGPFTVQEVDDTKRQVQILPRADAWLEQWWFVSA